MTEQDAPACKSLLFSVQFRNIEREAAAAAAAVVAAAAAADDSRSA